MQPRPRYGIWLIIAIMAIVVVNGIAAHSDAAMPAIAGAAHAPAASRNAAATPTIAPIDTAMPAAPAGLPLGFAAGGSIGIAIGVLLIMRHTRRRRR